MSGSSVQLERYIGNTIDDEFTLKDAQGAVVNITGYTFLMTVHTISNPPDATTQLFQLVGTITDAANGVFTFPFSPADADQAPGKYYLGIEATDSLGKIETLVTGVYKFRHNYNK